LWQSRFQVGERLQGRPWYQVFWWDLISGIWLLWILLFYRFRLVGFEKIPESGPVIYLSNHQSFYDPVLNGCGVTRRQFTSIAGEHLRRFKPLGWLIKSFGGVFVSSSAGSKGPLRAALSALELGRCVLIYPEGSRTPDGLVGPFQRGILLLLRKSSATVVPMAIEGAYDVWPRSRAFPRLSGSIVVVCGEPRSTEEILRAGPEAAMENLHGELDALRLEGRALLRKQSNGRWPKPGPADGPSPF
jgi:1-acyl-sn-glycerol-3-phosphate acyltransferase